MAILKRGRTYGVVVYDRGRREWVGTFRTKELAREAEAQALLDRRQQGDRITVQNFAKTWLERYPRQKRSTEIHYAQEIRRFAQDFAGWPLRDLRRPALRAWALEHSGSAKVARTMLGDAFRDGLIRENPLSGLRLPESRGRRDLEPPTEEDVLRLAETAVHVHGQYGARFYAPMLLMAAYTGLRPGELFALRHDDVDERTGTIRVDRQFSPKANEFTLPKNGRRRKAPLLAPALEAYKRVPFAGEELIFQTKNACMFSGKVSHYYWQPVRAAFGQPDLDWYALRHFFGTWLAQKGNGAPEIARAMGHIDGGKLALERYIHASEEDAFRSIRSSLSRPSLHVVPGEREAG